MSALVTVGGQPASRVAVHVPPVGPWWAEVDFEGDPTELEGRVTIAIGALELVGTVDPSHDGTHGLQRRSRIVAGAGAWATLLGPRAYHNDAGVRARTVVEDLVLEIGESLGDFTPAEERLGVDYVRGSGPASRTLEDVIGGASWWVAYDGHTRVGERPESTPDEGSYEVLEHQPDERIVTLAVDDLRAITIGSVLSARLDAPRTVRELELVVTPDSVRVRAWCGGQAGARGRLGSLFRALVQRVTDGQLFGVWRYRVIRMSVDRAELQSVRRAAGLPDILPISMWPGVAGAHAELAPGAEVLVTFVEGDRAQPIIVGFVGKGGPGFVPARLTLGAEGSAPNAAREGDTVRVTIPAGSFLVAASGGVLNGDPIDVDGTITSGSNKVGIGP